MSPRPGAAHWNFAAGVREDVIEVTGTDGQLSVSTFGDTPVEVRTAAGVARHEFANPRHIQQPLIETVVATLRGDGQCPSTGVSAARTSHVMDAVLADYYGGRTDAFWLRPRHVAGPSAVLRNPHPRGVAHNKHQMRYFTPLYHHGRRQTPVISTLPSGGRGLRIPRLQGEAR